LTATLIERIIGQTSWIGFLHAQVDPQIVPIVRFFIAGSVGPLMLA